MVAEGQHVGGRVDAAMLAVQTLQFGIVAEEHRQTAAGLPQQDQPASENRG